MDDPRNPSLKGTYFLWTEGCQMNAADSQRVGGALEALGYRPAGRAEEADVVVLNTCVVRQSAEDKAVGRLTSLRPFKERRPGMVINLMGCLVGRRPTEALRARYPYVDVFSPPSDPHPLVEFLTRDGSTACGNSAAVTSAPRVTAFVPVVLGCSMACSYCVIPSRRGGEQSRPAEEILAEVRALAAGGTREVTLLGQIVDRYGKDTGGPDLPVLLRRVAEIDGIWRIRFLTSHPAWMGAELLATVAAVPKVCPHIEVPVQAGDDEVLARMKRGYTAAEYRALVGRIRAALPDVSIATDIIVGFPGETQEQFRRTYDLLADLRLDTAHLARYSPRPGTVAALRYPDDVPEPEKLRRLQLLEALQEKTGAEKNAALVGTSLEILVEGMQKGRWYGRSPANQPVFFDDPSRNWNGQLARVKITRTTAWSLQGEQISGPE